MGERGARKYMNQEEEERTETGNKVLLHKVNSITVHEDQVAGYTFSLLLPRQQI